MAEELNLERSNGDIAFVDEQGIGRYHENYKNSMLHTREQIMVNGDPKYIPSANAVRSVEERLTADDGLPFNFVQRGGVYGHLRADGSFAPFNKVYNLGSTGIINGTSHAINIKNKLPNIYQTLTADNFITGCNYYHVDRDGWWDGDDWISSSNGAAYMYGTSHSYNASTGILTVNVSQSFGGSGDLILQTRVFAYVFLGSTQSV